FILIPMDDVTQTNHLKAYGITFWSLERGNTAKWLLNYEGGSFLLEDNEATRNECKIRGVTFQLISDTQAASILQKISSPSKNMEAVILEIAPKIAVYSPKDKMPWDDA
ncbi:asparagine synthetase B, partial [Gramella jeungdoensis]